MDEGNVIKAFVPQADGKYKSRPAILLKKLPYFDDWLICGISSKIHTVHKNFDLLINTEHEDYQNAGLPFPFVIRLGWLYAFPESRIEGDLGKINSNTLRLLQENLINFLG